ncbi:DUF2303 family protein [Microbulbifer celer]|uniref:DUF2303 family protein n=1 Tax=Microbulbifer celer TaxID=435905 RepID=A0ABW3U930_9GAMM|nr:DUF2303 family protein [Microbulbifer celer]UFN58547.1 YfdQ family protein [Microbulbifer celer]
MSMDKSAIEAIQAAQTVADLTLALKDAELKTPLAAVPDNFRLSSLEQYLPGRCRYRGTMETVALDDFTNYCEEFSAAGAACFVDPQKMTARSIFNLGDIVEPGHADFSAKLSLVKTAEYSALLDINGSRSNQKTMAEFLEDYQDSIVCYAADGEAIPNSKAIAAVRRLTIEASRREDHESQDFKASRSALESIEARSEHGLPAGFRFECTPYNGLNIRSFELRLSVLTGGDAPSLIARIKRLEAQQEEMGRELQEKLASAFSGTDIKTYIGSFAA